MSGRHAKRTTVKASTTWAGWRVDLATYDRPASPRVFVGVGARLRALNYAHSFGRVKARDPLDLSRPMEQRAGQWPR